MDINEHILEIVVLRVMLQKNGLPSTIIKE